MILKKIHSDKRNIKKDANWNYLSSLMFGLLIFYLLRGEPRQQAFPPLILKKNRKDVRDGLK